MSKYWRFLPIILLFILAIFIFPAQIKERQTPKLKLKLTNDAKDYIEPLLKNYPGSDRIELVNEDPDAIIETQKTPSEQDNIDLGYIDKTVTFSGAGFEKIIGKKINFYYHPVKSIPAPKLIEYLRENLKSKERSEISLILLGDIIPSRTVYLKMIQKGFDYPFNNVKNVTADADLTFGNLECPITDMVAPPTIGMDFSAPTKVIPGLQSLGLDLVTLANNHSTNYGSDVFVDTLKNLDAAGIKYVGGGINDSAAHELRIIETKGLKIGVLNYNSIIGGLQAGANSAGIAWLHMPPWSGEINAGEMARAKSEIAAARTKVDFLIAAIHWGVEYQLEPISAQVQVAHEAIDAGADLVWGSHPHVPSTFERYKEKLIIYNLGNFIFDQMWREGTREGVIAKFKIQKSKIKMVELIPYKITDYAQPQILPANSGRYIIERMMEKSKLE